MTQVSNAGTAILGGTFDPIHCGHLISAIEIRETLGIESLRLVPCKLPPHREAPGCSAVKRLEMVRLAVGEIDGLCVDDREMNRQGNSYTFDTLKSIREEIGEGIPLVMTCGIDSFVTLPEWYRWDKILEISHVLVLDRPGWDLDGQQVLTLLGKNGLDEPDNLMAEPSGYATRLTLTQLDISSTNIRTRVRQDKSVKYLIPDVVAQFIEENGIYRSR